MIPSIITSENSLDNVSIPAAKYTNASEGDPLEPHEEFQYLDLIRYILNEGEHRPDR